MPNPDYSMANPLLQQSEDGHAFIAASEPDNSRPSLEASGRPQGPQGIPQARGIGGTQVSARPVQASPKALTPQQMMALADGMEQDFLEGTVMSKAEQQMGRSSVSGSLDHGMPDWLNQYRTNEPQFDPINQTQTSGLDLVKQNEYLQEQERLRYMKSQRR